MSWKHRWDYHEAQTSVMERLQKEWTPPAAPCATPSTTLAKNRNGSLVPDCEEEKLRMLKCDSVRQMTRFYTYNLQLNDSHILQKTWQNVRINDLKGKSTESQLHKNDSLSKGIVRREIKLHYTVFQYSGPDKSHTGRALVFKRAYPHKIYLLGSAHNNSVKDSSKPFHLELPQCNLRVASVVPRKQANLCQHK